MPSMIRARTSATSSEDSVRSADPTVSRKETLLRPSGSGGPEYWRTNWIDSSSGPANPAMLDWSLAACSRRPARTERSNALDG